MKFQLLETRPHLYIVVIVVTDHHVQHGSAVDIELFKLNKLKWERFSPKVQNLFYGFDKKNWCVILTKKLCVCHLDM